jgi:hypothetical protein
VCVSWILLHVTVRYQPYISRLQTPVFMLFPCFLAAWAPISKFRPVRFFFTSILIVSTMACLSYGLIAAMRNEIRPLKLTDFWLLDRDSSYYASQPAFKQGHDEVIEAVKQMKAKRVGLAIGGGYDYPLSWRLYRLGVEVHHIFWLEWADIVYFYKGRVPAVKNWSAYKGNNSVLINPQFEQKVLKEKSYEESQRLQK